jgi:hypothetical protein
MCEITRSSPLQEEVIEKYVLTLRERDMEYVLLLSLFQPQRTANKIDTMKIRPHPDYVSTLAGGGIRGAIEKKTVLHRRPVFASGYSQNAKNRLFVIFEVLKCGRRRYPAPLGGADRRRGLHLWWLSRIVRVPSTQAEAPAAAGCFRARKKTAL